MRRIWLASVVGAVVLVTTPMSAGAATQIGQTFDPTADPCDDETVLQSGSPAGQYAAPSDGVITRWSFQSPAIGTDVLKFKVARPAGGNSFTIIGESALVDPVTGVLNNFLIRIPVKTGDVIGIFWPLNSANCSRLASSAYTQHSNTDDVVPPNTAAFTPQSGFQLDLSASLEPDCDGDGLGDETQDSDLALCNTTCKGERVTKVGTSGPDDIDGTPNRDIISGLGGKDEISGLAGKDLICGGRGRDTLRGGKGKDKLYGQKGKDRLVGGGGKDRCVGGKKDDTAKKCEIEKSI